MEFLDIIYMVTLFIIGCLFGSFFTLATYRIPKKQDILIKQSYCPNCEHKLGFFDLFPILSYVFIGGKCRYCKQKISIKYPLFELGNGLVFIIFYLIFKLSIALALVILVYATCFVLIGSYINYRFNISKEKSGEKNLKNKGFVNAELVIGVAMYALFFISILVTNYNNKIASIEIVRRSNAIDLAVSSTEKYQKTDYSDVVSYNDEVTIADYKYKRSVQVTKYQDVANTTEDLIKQITVKIEYKTKDKYDDFELKSVKVNKMEE